MIAEIQNEAPVNDLINEIDPVISFFPVLKETNNISSITILQALKQIETGHYEAQIKDIRSETDKEKRRKLKEGLPSITPSGTFKERRDNALLNHSGFICLDFDDVENVEELKAQLSKDEYIFAAFESPSGNGVKALVRIPKDNHLGSFLALKERFPKIDDSGKNVSRLCFVSYDPDMFINHDSKVFTKTKPKSKPKKKPTFKQTKRSTPDLLENLISQVGSYGLDITEGYEAWRNIGFALVDEYGEAGRQYFHDLSMFHLDYEPSKTDDQYNKCLRSNGSGITIAYLLGRLKDFGVTYERKTTMPFIEPKNRDVEFINNHLSVETVISSLPETIIDILKGYSTASGKAIDYYLGYVLVSLSVVCGKVRLEVSPGWEVSPNIFMIIAGLSGDGKTVAGSHITKPFNQIEKKFSEDYILAMSSFKNLEKDDQVKNSRPIRRSILLKNSTHEATIQALEYNPAILISHNEGTALVKTDNYKASGKGTEQEFQMSAYDGESIKINRKNQDDIYIEKPVMSIVANSTLSNLSKFFDRGKSNNGFTHRLLWVFPERKDLPLMSNNLRSDSKELQKWSDLILSLYNDMERMGEVLLTIEGEAQKKLFDKHNEFITETNNTNDEVVRGMIAKLRTNLNKLVIILHVAFCKCSNSELRLKVSVCAVDAAVSLIDYFRANHEKVLDYVDNPKLAYKQLDQATRDIFDNLENTFSTKHLKDLCVASGMNEKQAQRIIAKNPKLIKKIKHGEYRKTI